MLERIRLVISIFWERLVERAGQSLTNHLIDHCDECGGRLIFDMELTTRKGQSEWMSFTCAECGAENKRLMALD